MDSCTHYDLFHYGAFGSTTWSSRERKGGIQIMEAPRGRATTQSKEEKPIKTVTNIYGVWCAKCSKMGFAGLVLKKLPDQMQVIGQKEQNGTECSIFACEKCGASIMITYRVKEERQ